MVSLILASLLSAYAPQTTSAFDLTAQQRTDLASYLNLAFAPGALPGATAAEVHSVSGSRVAATEARVCIRYDRQISAADWYAEVQASTPMFIVENLSPYDNVTVRRRMCRDGRIDGGYALLATMLQSVFGVPNMNGVNFFSLTRTPGGISGTLNGRFSFETGQQLLQCIAEAGCGARLLPNGG